MQEYQSADDRWSFLASWTALLCEHEIAVKTKFLSDHTYRFRFEAIELVMQRSVITDAATHDKIRDTAEAVELVATALALFPDAWGALLVNQCRCQYFDPALHARDELVPRFEFNCHMYPGEVLMTEKGLQFFQILLDSSTRSNKFHVAMRQLMSLDGGVRLASSCTPVPLKIVVSMWNEDDDDTILAHHVDFVHALKPYNRPQPAADTRSSWCFVEQIEVDLSGPGITSTVVARALQLATEAPFLQFDRVTIDPKETVCSSEELLELMATLATTYPDLSVDVGAVIPGSSGIPGHFDRDGSDSSSDPKIALVTQAIARTPCSLKSLSMGHLMTRAPVERDRRHVVWGHLFGTLLHPSAVCAVDSLILSSSRILHVPADAFMIQQAAAAWPGYKTPCSLTLELANANQASVHAIVRAFGRELRHLRITDSERSTESATVSFILDICPNLVYLDIESVNLDTMEVFLSDPATCKLSTLVLSNVTLKERSSLTIFLTQLADPQSSIGRTLGEFVLVRTGDPEDVWDKLVLDREQLFLVASVLRYNGRVHTLEVHVEDSTPEWLFPVFTRQHRQPAAVQQAPLALKNKLAFLSATIHSGADADSAAQRNLSHDVIGLVFGFAAECTARWVIVSKSFDDELDE